MEFSKLNQRIIFLEKRTVVDEIGNHTSKWEEAFCVWAYVTASKSDEQNNAGVTAEKQTLVFWIRENSYSRQITTTGFRIAFRGDVYNIVSIIPDYVKRDYLKITAERVAKEDGFECD